MAHSTWNILHQTHTHTQQLSPLHESGGGKDITHPGISLVPYKPRVIRGKMEGSESQILIESASVPSVAFSQWSPWWKHGKDGLRNSHGLYCVWSSKQTKLSPKHTMAAMRKMLGYTEHSFKHIFPGYLTRDIVCQDPRPYLHKHRP